MFRRLFGLAEVADGDHERGKQLFELGLTHFNRRECSQALELFTQSIDACKNPAPHLARAQILINRIRYQEALQDILQARTLDRQFGEFSTQIDAAMATAEAVTCNYRNGTREKLIADYQVKGTEYAAKRILQESFHGRIDLIDYYFFNELDNVVRFDDLQCYPEVQDFLFSYPIEFVDIKVESSRENEEYRLAELTIHGFLCSYPEPDMRQLRRRLIYDAHCEIMEANYGAFWMSITSDNPGVTRDADDFINGRA